MFDLSPETVMTYGIPAVTALLIIVGGLIASSWLSSTIRRFSDGSKLDPTLSRFFSRIARWTVLLVTALFVLGEFGIETASFSVILGAAGLAIGLALQGTLSNFACGVMLLMFRPFKVGDVIRAAGELGKVYEIDLFSTAVDTPDNRRLIIPNSKVFGDTIENLTYHPQRRADVAVGVGYGASISETRLVLTSACSNTEGLLSDPEPAVVLTSLGASSVDWVVRGWANRDDFAAVKERLTVSVKEGLDAAGISIPFPQLDVHINESVESQSN